MQRIRSDRTADPLAELSDQERAVFDLIGEGLTNREIGARLFLAEKTVKNYVTPSALEAGHAASYSGCGAGDRNP